MYPKVTIYTTRNEVFEHEILPLIRPYENEYHLEFLKRVLTFSYVDASGDPYGYGLTIVSDEIRNGFIRDAFHLAKHDKHKDANMTETYADMLTRTNLW